MVARVWEAWDCSFEGAVGLEESLEPQAVRVRDRKRRASWDVWEIMWWPVGEEMIV